MAVTGFAHYNLTAPHDLLEQIKAFYCDVIGLQIGWRPPLDRPGYWLYVGEHALLHLIENRPDDIRQAHVAGTLDHVAFTCTDAPVMEARLRQYAIPFRSSMVPVSGELQFFCHDPAGNGVELNFAPVNPGD